MQKSRILLSLCALALVVYLFSQQGGRSPFYEPWAVFHNYLSAKYFNEIGPFDFYACVIEADKEANHVWPPDQLVRDLHTYHLVESSSLRCPRGAFTDARWKEFVHDVATLTNTAPADYWAQALTDKGYNATPFWSVLFGAVANVVPVDSTIGSAILFNLDFLFVAASIGIVWYFAGETAALLTLVFALGYFGNFGRIGGNFAQYLWFPVLALAIGAWAAKKPTLSGIAFGAAAALQVFPVFFTVPLAVAGVRQFFHREKGFELTRRFFTWLSITLAIAFVIGSLSTHGIYGWSAWRDKIALHSSYLHSEIFDIGVANLVSDVYATDRSGSSTYAEDTPHSFARAGTLREHTAIWFGVAGVYLVLLVAAAWRGSENSLPVLGFVGLYALLSLSPYYYFSLALTPLMLDGMQKRERNILLGLVISLLIVHLVWWGGSYISFSFSGHEYSEFLFAVVMLAVPATILYPTLTQRRT